MKRLKRILRLCGLVLFLLLAVGGVSFTGAAPAPPKGRNIIGTEMTIETEEDDSEDTEDVSVN